MATCKCKDCIHNTICKAYTGFGIDTKYDDNDTCELFKSNSHYVEIPCYCKECKYCFESNVTDRFFCTYHDADTGYTFEVFEDDYCSYGERDDKNEQKQPRN